MDIPTRFACFGCRVTGWAWRRNTLNQNCRRCYTPMTRVSAQGMAAPAVENNAEWDRMRLLADETRANRAVEHAAIVAMIAQIRRLPPGVHRGMSVTPLSSDQLGLKDRPDWGR